jgi:2-keto-4-pentenoate hydratase
MTPLAIQQAASLLAQARRSGVLLDGFPASCRPANIDDAHAIQDATLVALNETVAGWKVALPLEGRTVHGAIIRSRVVPSGGSIRAAEVPLLGVEAEVAFRFDRDLPPRDRRYTYEEIAETVTAFPAIEIVDSRFRDYGGAPLIERIADCVSNGAFVQGAPQPRWREFDLTRLDVRLVVDGELIARRTGDHPAGNPFAPAVELANAMREREGVRAGQFATTGSFTGLNFAKAGQKVTAILEGFGSADVHLVA